MDPSTQEQELISSEVINLDQGQQFEWYCFENNLEKRNILENELPKTYNYKVNRFKVMEEKKEPYESKFEADFIVDICTEEVRDNFIKDFEEKTGTNFNISKSQRIGKGGSKQKLLKCTRNLRSKLSENKQSGGKGSGSGPVSVVKKRMEGTNIVKPQ